MLTLFTLLRLELDLLTPVLGALFLRVHLEHRSGVVVEAPHDAVVHFVPEVAVGAGQTFDVQQDFVPVDAAVVAEIVHGARGAAGVSDARLALAVEEP